MRSAATESSRLQVVARVRDFQRDWLERTRERALDGEAFGICNADEFEELLGVMEIPVLVINPWNFMIVAQGKAAHFSGVLERRGYAGPHFFALGLASTMEPAQAPRGGLPKPAFVLGTTRSEGELRVTELWAREYGVPCIPLEFNLGTPSKAPPGPGWWRLTRDRWPELTDEPRLELRLAQVKEALAAIESITGKAFSVARLTRAMDLVNRQVDLVAEVRALIASAPRCPVSVRDQLSLYQPMWHRGTPVATELFTAYRNEVAGGSRPGSEPTRARTIDCSMPRCSRTQSFTAFSRESSAPPSSAPRTYPRRSPTPALCTTTTHYVRSSRASCSCSRARRTGW